MMNISQLFLMENYMPIDKYTICNEQYIVWVDTCSLLHYGFMKFYRPFYGKGVFRHARIRCQLHIPKSVITELKRHADIEPGIVSEKNILKKKAQEVLNIIKHDIEDDNRTFIIEESLNSGYADKDFIELFKEVHEKKPVLITQDYKLSENISSYVIIRKLNNYGELEEFR